MALNKKDVSILCAHYAREIAEGAMGDVALAVLITLSSDGKMVVQGLGTSDEEAQVVAIRAGELLSKSLAKSSAAAPTPATTE